MPNDREATAVAPSPSVSYRVEMMCLACSGSLRDPFVSIPCGHTTCGTCAASCGVSPDVTCPHCNRPAVSLVRDAALQSIIPDAGEFVLGCRPAAPPAREPGATTTVPILVNVRAAGTRHVASSVLHVPLGRRGDGNACFIK